VLDLHAAEDWTASMWSVGASAAGASEWSVLSSRPPKIGVVRTLIRHPYGTRMSIPPKATVAFIDAPSAAGCASPRSSVMPPKMMAVNQVPWNRWAVQISFGPPNDDQRGDYSAPASAVVPTHRFRGLRADGGAAVR
jgi:hypothetical protein